MLRRLVARAPLSGGQWVAKILAHRLTMSAVFTVVVLIVAAQALHAKEYGGFVGERPLLTSFITSDLEDDAATETILGPATVSARPTFHIASVSAAFGASAAGPEARVPTVSIANAILVQPILSDAAAAENGRAGIQTYTVEDGDTLSTIAEKFGITTQTVLWENKLSALSTIRAGDQLRILPIDGVSHVVAKNDTLDAIAKKYSGDAEDILEYNDLVEADDIESGDVLVIPGGRPPTVIAPVAPRRVPVLKPASPLPSIPGKLLWPSAAGYRISQYYTWRHHGIDIAIAQGTPVFASEGGTITYAGWMAGYGYQVTIDHGNGFKTRYAHNSRLLVKKGEQVARGQTISLVGSTGRSTGAHIHFEIFVNGVRVNPFQYLR